MMHHREMEIIWVSTYYHRQIFIPILPLNKYFIYLSPLFPSSPPYTLSPLFSILPPHIYFLGATLLLGCGVTIEFGTGYGFETSSSFAPPSSSTWFQRLEISSLYSCIILQSQDTKRLVVYKLSLTPSILVSFLEAPLILTNLTALIMFGNILLIHNALFMTIKER